MSNNIRVIYPLWVFLLISVPGCELASSPVKVTVNFSDAQGIQSSDPVEFNGENIGAVNAVEPATPGAIVHLQLDPTKTSAIQSNAVAKIAADGGKRRVEISNPPEPGGPIADGATLRELKPETGLAAIGDELTDMSETVEPASSPIKVTVNFSDAQGIQSSDPVEFNGENIGAVNAVEPATPGAIVHLQLDPTKTSAIQSNAVAKIATDGGKRRVEISNPPAPGGPIADGAILRGLKPKTGWAAIGDVLTDTSETVTQAASQAKGHVDRTRKEWDDAKTNIDDLLKDLSGQSKTITKELQTEVESLFKIMEAKPRGVEAKPGQQLAQVEEKYQALESNCAQKQRDLNDQGQKDAAAAVQELCEQVEIAVDLYKQEGA